MTALAMRSAGQKTTFVSRGLVVTFRMGGNGFGAAGQDVVTLTGLRVSADIVQARFPAAEIATLRLEGVNADLMNRLSLMVPDIFYQSISEVLIEVQEGQSVPVLVFRGGVTLAYADYRQAPECAFMVQALSTALPNAMPATPTAFKGAVQAATLLQTIAQKAGLTFVNHGVEATFYNPYLDGSPGQQIARCLEAVPVRAGLGRGQLSVWPSEVTGTGTSAASAGQQSDAAVAVSAATGLVGYPSWSAGGLSARMLFSAQIGFNTLIALQSRYQPAGQGNVSEAENGPVGLWRVIKAHHFLQSEVPGGGWFTDIIAQAVR